MVGLLSLVYSLLGAFLTGVGMNNRQQNVLTMMVVMTLNFQLVVQDLIASPAHIPVSHSDSQ